MRSKTLSSSKMQLKLLSGPFWIKTSFLDNRDEMIEDCEDSKLKKAFDLLRERDFSEFFDNGKITMA